MANKLTKKLRSTNQQERLERKEFELEIRCHADVLVALLNARNYHTSGSRAQRAYDNMILQLFAVHVSDAARERYKQGFSEEQFDAWYESDDCVATVISCEAGMLKALEEMAPWNGGHIEEMLADYFYHLHLRWQFVRMRGLAEIEQWSGNGANLASDTEDTLNVIGSHSWHFIPLPELDEPDGIAGDASGGSVIAGLFAEH